MDLAELKGKQLAPANWRDLPDLTNEKFIGLDLSKPPVPGKMTICLLCAKPFIMPQFIGEPDQVCPECIKTYRDTAKIVCRKCRKVIARQKPKVLDCGFYIQPRSILHVDKCNNCSPGLLVCKVVEIDEYMKRNFIPKQIVAVHNPWIDAKKFVQ
jgi:hypothetical protein